jgi:hypothetical protein
MKRGALSVDVYITFFEIYCEHISFVCCSQRCAFMYFNTASVAEKNLNAQSKPRIITSIYLIFVIFLLVQFIIFIYITILRTAEVAV